MHSKLWILTKKIAENSSQVRTKNLDIGSSSLEAERACAVLPLLTVVLVRVRGRNDYEG